MRRLATSTFALMLHLYPASFREEYGREMKRLFADRLRGVGRLEAAFIWTEAIAGTLRGAPKEHLSLMLSDVLYAIRILRRARWFTATALVTLALGIGATTAIFSAVETLLLRQLPYTDPDRIVMVWVTNPEQGFDHDITSYPRLEDWRAQSRTIALFTGFNGATHALTGSDEPEQLRGSKVTANFFEVMGAQPAVGATFSPADDDPGRPSKVVLSHALWTRRFGANPGIVGRTVTMDGRLYTVTGVMPSSFRYPTPDTDFWEPLAPSDELRRLRGAFWLTAVARLKPAVTLGQAQQEMDAISRRLRHQYREDRGLGVHLVGLQNELTANIRPALLVLAGAVAFVLLIACANVAGMLLARASDRQREMSLRAALGAGRGRVIRQLLTEAVLLFVVGGASGLAVAAAATRALVRLAPPTLTQIRDVRIDWAVAAFAMGLAVLTGLVFGAAPAIQAARRDQADAIRGGSPRISGQRGAARFRAGLLGAEVALAFVLLTGAGLLLRSFAQMQSVDLGFDAHNIIAARISLPSARYDDGAKSIAFFEALLERIRATPGVESAGGVTALLLNPLPNSAGFQIEGRPEDIATPLTYDAVTPEFFRTMRIRLLRGRLFTSADGATAQRVTIINQTTAKRYWPNEDPVGRRIRFGEGVNNEGPWLTIVGVVDDTKRAGIDRPVFTESYQPLKQSPPLRLSIVVRASTDTGSAARAIRATVHQIDPQQPVANVASLQSMLDDTMAGRRFNTMLVTIFALVAVLLAAAGLYGLLAYIVGQQQHEIGVRMALGASAAHIVRSVARRALAAACAGGALGIVLSVGLNRAITGMLFHVGTIDPISYAGATFVLAAVVTLAAIVPIKRALSVDPAVSLRAE